LGREFVDYYPVTRDSIWVCLENNYLELVTHNSKKAWDIKPLLRAQIADTTAFMAMLFGFPLTIFSDTVSVATSTARFRTDNNGPHVPFMKANYDVQFKIVGDSVRFIRKHNPNYEYFYVQDYRKGVERTFINSDVVVYSYSHSDTLDMIDFKAGTIKRTVLQTNNFQPNKPFEDAKGGDFKYLVEYVMEQSRLSTGMYDKYREHFYQFLKHKGVYIEKDGTQNIFASDVDQSLFVLDKNLTQEKEIFIPPKTFKIAFKMFVTPGGLYAPAHESKQKYRDKTLFYKIVIP
ncbi:MAG: hypothetical protein QM642_11550, partial [Edaphocola sp.]